MTKKPAKRKAPAHHVDHSNDTVAGQTQSNEVTGGAPAEGLDFVPPSAVAAEPPPIPGVAVSEGLDPDTPPNAN